VRAVTTLAAAGVLVAVVDWGVLLGLLRGMSAAGLLCAFLLGWATHALLGIRWFVIARARMAGNLLFHFGVYWRASLFNFFTPAALGADVFRVLTLRGGAVGPGVVTALIVRERFTGLAGYLASYLGALTLAQPAAPFFSRLAPFMAVGLLALGAAWAALPRAGRMLGSKLGVRYGTPFLQLAAALPEWRGRDLLLALALTLFACATWFMMVMVLARELGSELGFGAAAMTAVIGELVRILPLSIQGVGLRESAFGYAFHAAGLRFESGVATGGVVYLLYNAVVGLAGLAATIIGGKATRDD
jgi:uncharacterized membrane protein YbhN (UPF0104 family)